MRRFLRRRGLAVAILALFLLSWAGQLVFQALEFVAEQSDHGQRLPGWTDALGEPAFWHGFWRATLENWQSEWLQVATFVIATAYLVYHGSAESADSDERIEAKVDYLLRRAGVDPSVVERELPERHRR